MLTFALYLILRLMHSKLILLGVCVDCGCFLCLSVIIDSMCQTIFSLVKKLLSIAKAHMSQGTLRGAVVPAALVAGIFVYW